MRIAAMTTGIFLSLIGSCYAQTSTAVMARFETRIPPQALGSALKQLARLDHIELLYVTADVKDLHTAGASGNLTAGETLTRLLSGTGLTYRYVDGNAISIVPIGSAPKQDKQKNSTRQVSDRRASSISSDPIPAYRTGQEPSVRPFAARDDESSSKSGSARRDEAALQKITVTGTRIPGVQPVGVPIQTITVAQINQSGYTSTDQLLQSLPDVFRGGGEGATPDARFQRGQNAGYNTAGGSGVDLRGLGAGATLVLFNGHRIASSASGYFTDISNIPLSAIDHIDVLTDGASAIYGSDAIAGVVNIEPKQKGGGLTTGARYGYGNGFSLFDANLGFGSSWNGGGFDVDTDYSEQGALDVRDRSFTSSVKSPTSLFPLSHNVWISVAGHQRISNAITMFGDAEYSEARRQLLYFASSPVAKTFAAVPRWSGALGASYALSPSWVVSLTYAGGEGIEHDLSNTIEAGSTQLTQLLSGVREVERFSEPTLRATGDLFALPGGAVSMAIGGDYLSQSFSHVDYEPSATYRFGAARNVKSAYGEVRIPVVTRDNRTFGISKLIVAAAGRYDRYSDFGGTTNYKVGVSWYPDETVQVRGAYSTSFRAPDVGEELVESERGTTGVLLFPMLNPQGTAKVPVLLLEGAIPDLRPETATNLTLGLDYTPMELPNIKWSLNYYRIRYIGQLASAPFELTALGDPALASVVTQYRSSNDVAALVAESVAKGALFVDATGGKYGTDPLASTTYVYDIRTANLSRTNTSGFDLQANYGITVGLNRVTSLLDATYIKDFSTQLTPRSAVLEEVNAVGFPASLRITGQLAWTAKHALASVTGVYVGSYRDTSIKPAGRVSSYTTVNSVFGYRWSRGLGEPADTEITVSVANLLNRNPPFVVNGALLFVGSHYDAANANPMGRVVSLQVSTLW